MKHLWLILFVVPLFAVSARVINIASVKIEKSVSFDYSGPIDELLKRGMKKIAIELIQ